MLGLTFNSSQEGEAEYMVQSSAYRTSNHTILQKQVLNKVKNKVWFNCVAQRVIKTG